MWVVNGRFICTAELGAVSNQLRVIYVKFSGVLKYALGVARMVRRCICAYILTSKDLWAPGLFELWLIVLCLKYPL